MLESLSDSDTSDSDISDEDKVPIEEIASSGKLLTPQEEGNKETSNRKSFSRISEDKSSDHNNGSGKDINENASDSEDGSKREGKISGRKGGAQTLCTYRSTKRKPCKSTATPPAKRQCTKYVVELRGDFFLLPLR